MIIIDQISLIPDRIFLVGDQSCIFFFYIKNLSRKSIKIEEILLENLLK